MELYLPLINVELDESKPRLSQADQIKGRIFFIMAGFHIP
jgi:hypothetical protein